MGSRRSNFFDLQVPFFVPVWRRVLLVVVCLGWSLFEFATAAPFFGIIFGSLGVFALWQLFFDGWPRSDDEPPRR